MLYSEAIKDPKFGLYPKFSSRAFYDIRFSDECRNKYLKIRANKMGLELITDIGLVLDVYKSKDVSMLSVKNQEVSNEKKTSRGDVNEVIGTKLFTDMDNVEEGEDYTVDKMEEL